jgi:hypothetical protein
LNAIDSNKTAAPHWTRRLNVWLKSEFLDNSNFARFGAEPVVFEQPSWPLGLRVRNDRTGDMTVEAALAVIDTGFDHDVSCAWQLPLRYSRLTLGERFGAGSRDDLNWLIRSVGHWQKDEERHRQIAWGFQDDGRFAWKSHRTVRTGYALTPFCTITQRWTEDHNDSSRAELLFCDIALFYTFETFIQECLALEAYRKGVNPADITAAYEHIYCNSRPRPELIRVNPAEFALYRLAGGHVDWQSILNLKHDDSDVNLIQSMRLNLFKTRRQCHLMAAIAAACIGIPALATSTNLSSAVQIGKTPFASDGLAAHWLKHMTGVMDYASECDSLLTVLATHCGNPVSLNYRGVPEPAPWLATTSVEEVVARETPPILLSAGEPEGYGRYRWALFDTNLDDQSLRKWRQKLKKYSETPAALAPSHPRR